MEDLDFSNELVFEEKSLFLFLYIPGKINLYQYTDEWESEHFFIEKDGQTVELQTKLYYSADNKSKILQTQTYKRQLTSYMKDCTAITEREISDLNYDNGIINLVKKYNACHGEAVTYAYNPEKVTAKFGLVAALTTTYLNIRDANYMPLYPYNTSFKPSFDPAAGLSVFLTMPRTNKKIGFYSELLYRRYKAEDIMEESSSNYHAITSINYTGNYIKWNTFFRYQFALNQLKPYFHAGLSNGFALSKIDKITKETTFYSETSKREVDFFKGARKYERGFVFGLGGEIKRMGFELRAEKADGFSNIRGVITRVHTVYTLINYRF